MLRRSTAALLACSALVAIGGPEAQAGAFATRQHSVVAAGQAYAGAGAAGFGLSGMFWNPAVVTSMAGRNSDWNLFAIMPQTRLEDLSVFNNNPNPLVNAGINAGIAARGLPGEYGTSLLSTGSYNNLQLTPDLFIGVSVNAPYGSGVNPGGGWAGNFDVSRTRLSTINVQPVVGYRINEQLSIAIGAQIQHLRLTQEQTIAALGPLNGALARLEGDDIGFGFTAGITWTPMPGTQLGIGFRSAVEHTVEGSQSLFVSPPGVPGCVAGAYCSRFVTADITLPELVTAGFRQNITPDLAVSGTIEWQNWSRVGVVNVNGSPTGANLPLNYRDGWYYALGLDYRLNQNVTLRTGVGFERTPVQDQWRTVSIPDADRLWIGAGMTYDVSDRFSFSLSYTYIKLNDERVRRPTNADGSIGALTPVPTPGVPGGIFPTRIGYEATAESQIHILGISARFRFDEPPPAAGAIIVKP